MTLEEKRDVISKNKDPAIAALTAVIDTLYNVTDPVVNNKDNVKTAMFKNRKAEDIAVTLKQDIEKYEPIRLKLQKNDFNLSAREIAYVNLAFFFCSERAKNQIESMTKAKELCDTICGLLSSQDETQPVSEEEAKAKFEAVISQMKKT